jgi:hypothetical protein
LSTALQIRKIKNNPLSFWWKKPDGSTGKFNIFKTFQRETP